MENNNKMTFEYDDALDFGEFADNLVSFIKTDRKFVDESLIISLNGKFGSGKSTFFEMLANRLEDDSSYEISPIKLNAWESDYDKDPLLSIITSFIEHFEKNGEKTRTNRLKILGGQVARFGLNIGNQIVENKLGINFQEAGEQSGDEKLEIISKACFEIFNDRKNALTELKILLKEIVGKSEKIILVMVDELDRCRPDYAVEYLETIKHIFDIKGIIFILGVDETVLSSSVTRLFGENINFDEYYRKFVHRRIQLPTVSFNDQRDSKNQNLQAFVRQLIEKYVSSNELEREGRISFAKWERYNLQRTAELFSDLSLTPRQMIEVFRLLAHLLKGTEFTRGKMNWGWQTMTIFMATLNVSNHKLYHQIGRSNASLEDITSLFSSMRIISTEQNSYEWWLPLFFLANSKKSNSEDWSFTNFINSVQKNENYDEESANRVGKNVSDAFSGRIPSQYDILSEIYEKIESINSFAQN